MVKKTVWSCRECGHNEPKWSGQCFSCGGWNSFVEEILVTDRKRSRGGIEIRPAPIPLSEVREEEVSRLCTGIGEWDRLLGGGVVPGSLILVGGDPGIGKSTLLLQCAGCFAKKQKVLYVTGEESAAQVSMRARRLNVASDALYLLTETSLGTILEHIERLAPTILIIDSIQVLYKEEIPSSPGSLVQVREIASELMRLSKSKQIATFLIGHVTKTGEIAGPRVLEHLVDVVLYFEGDKHLNYRMLRAVKNRFGSIDEIAVFQMAEKGLVEVTNPSGLFIEERMKGNAGSCVIATVEGTRPILVEVQALVTQTIYSTPTRRSAGIDGNRLALLLAVLEKRVGYLFHNRDVFVSLTGGLRAFEPAMDLGILLTLVSSFSNRVVDPELVVMGEVGLGGEIRTVSRIESRLKESVQMGFKKALVPKRALKGLSEMSKKIQIISADFVEEAIDAILP